MYEHLPAADLPLALAEVHRTMAVADQIELTAFAALAGTPTADDVRTRWDPDHLSTVVEAAGFSVDHTALVANGREDQHCRIELTATARRALPDYVGPGLRLLCCGLNPSLHAADAGVGYVTGSNRFWRAMAAAGLATCDRDPLHLVRHDHIGMTDLVKRATPRADELRVAEYRTGVERLDALCGWLQPAALAVVGLAGWRAAVNRKATTGWQPEFLGGTPVYVLPSTSGLNARVSLAELAGHLAAAADGPG